MTSSLPTPPFSRVLARYGRSFVMAPLLFGALVLTGCGGGGSDEPDADIDAQTPTAASAAPSRPQPRIKIGNEISDSEALQADRRLGDEVRRVP